MQQSVADEIAAAQANHKEIVETIRAMNVLSTSLADLLRASKRNGYWKMTVGEGGTWAEYLSSPEVDMTVHSAGTQIRAASILESLDYSLDDVKDVSFRRLKDIAKVAKLNRAGVLSKEQTESVRELIETAGQHMGSADFSKALDSFREEHPKSRSRSDSHHLISEGVCMTPDGSHAGTVIGVRAVNGSHHVKLRINDDAIRTNDLLRLPRANNGTDA